MTKLANVADESGGMKRARVCGKCFDGALHIVARVVKVTKGPDEIALARREARDATKAATKKLRALAQGYYRENNEEGTAHARGLEQAADVLEAGDY